LFNENSTTIRIQSQIQSLGHATHTAAEVKAGDETTTEINSVLCEHGNNILPRMSFAFAHHCLVHVRFLNYQQFYHRQMATGARRVQCNATVFLKACTQAHARSIKRL
jgi:hypothetical protein